MNSHQTPPPWWGWGLFHLRFDSSYVHFPDHLKQNKYCRFRFKSVSRQQPLLIKNTREPFERGRAQTLISSLCPHCESWDFSGYQGTLEKKQYSPQSAPIYLNKNTHIQWQMHPPAQNPTIALAVISLKKKRADTKTQTLTADWSDGVGSVRLCPLVVSVTRHILQIILQTTAGAHGICLHVQIQSGKTDVFLQKHKKIIRALKWRDAVWSKSVKYRRSQERPSCRSSHGFF